MNKIKDWTFNEEHIAKAFDNHVREQLPWYDLVSKNILEPVARHYIPQSGRVYDIGCATGNVSKILGPIFSQRDTTVTSIDNSSSMIKRFNGYGEVVCKDATEYTYEPFDFAVLFLTLIFIPVAKRVIFIDALKKKLNRGGAIFVVEKFLPAKGYPGLVASRITLQSKLMAGCTADEIINKELSLSGIQRPLSRNELGGHEIFRFGDFSAYIITDAMADQRGNYMAEYLAEKEG